MRQGNSKLKVALVSNVDGGGAGKAAYRLHQGLRLLDVDSTMLVEHKTVVDDRVIASTKFSRNIGRLTKRILNACYRSKVKGSEHYWSLNRTPRETYRRVQRGHPDIVNLHWLGESFFSASDLSRIKVPIVWTFHDMWAFTGGCHYAGVCMKYRAACGSCPQLKVSHGDDASANNWSYKQKWFAKANFVVVTPSRWLKECTLQSSLMMDCRVEVIPYGLDTDLYQPVDKRLARQRLGIPYDGQILLFGAMGSTSNPRKGFDLLKKSLQILSDRELPISLCILGSNENYDNLGLPFPGTCLGHISDEHKLALAYSAADVFVAPSREDNLPNTVLEAMSCGTPCVAFNIGGMPDMIRIGANGFLAKPFCTESLANSIELCLHSICGELGNNARKIALQEYSLLTQATRYTQLYQELISMQNHV